LYKPKEILDRIDSRLRKFVADVRFRESDNTLLIYVPSQFVSDKSSKEKTSRRQLENLKARLEAIYERNVEIILDSQAQKGDMEEAYRNFILNKFPNSIDQLFISLNESNQITTWIQSLNSNETLRADIELFYLTLLHQNGSELSKIEWLNLNSELPSDAWILKKLKTYQPIDIEKFLDLVKSKYPRVEAKWFRNRLDSLRKKGFLVRGSSDCYCLTSKGLDVVPVGPWGNSSDIERALALGRKKW